MVKISDTKKKSKNNNKNVVVNKHFNRRLITVYCVMIMSAVLLFFVTANISIDPFYEETLLNQSSYTVNLPKQKGFIYDRDLTPLVNTQKTYVASVVPSQVDANTLYQYSTLSKGEIDELLKQHTPFLCPVSTNEFSANGITVFEQLERYSEGETLAQHIIGYENVDREGVSGLEKAFNDYLSIDGRSSVTYTVNGKGEPFSDSLPKIDIESASTKGVVTTIDKDIQQICESVGEKYLQKGAIVVMDPYTGELVSVCSFPTYSPFDLAESVNDTENSPMINRAFSPISVGSTFKSVIASTALENGFSKFLSYECKGKIDISEQVSISCHYQYGHGVLDMKEAMMQSCNPYFINLGLQLDQKDLLEMANNMSFGKSTKLADGYYIPSGNLPSVEQMQSEGTVANFSFGQGEILGSPVQVAQMISCVVNGGKTPNATLIKGYCEDSKTITDKVSPSFIEAMSEGTAKQVQEFLVACVMEKENQNAKPMLTTAGGKTGTAQTGVFVDGKELNNGWFAGFFPADEPKYTVVVISEDAISGNNNASPAFREIADKITALDK